MKKNGVYCCKRSFPFKRILTGLIAAGFIFSSSACQLMPKEEPELPPPIKEPPKQEYKTNPVTRGTLVDEVKNVTAKFVCLAQTEVSFPEKGMKLKEFKVKKGDKVNVGDVLVEADTTDLENTIKEKEISLRKQELTYAQQKLNGADGYTLLKTSIDIDAARESLENLKKNLEQAKLVAPVSGEVSFVDDTLKEGDTIDAKRVLVKIADLSQLQLESTGNANLSKIKLGMKATVNYNNKQYEGVVVATPRDNQNTSDGKNVVRIKVNNLTDGVKAIDDTASFSVVTEVKENVLKTYKNYVSQKDGKNIVYVLENGIKTARTVELGLQTGNEVEIVSGLKEGELVIVP